MKRSQLEHVVRAAAEITGVRDVLVIGSQAVLGTHPEWELPPEATMSNEADVGIDLALAKVDGDPSEFADHIEGSLGRGSRFHETFHYYADGVEPTTAALTEGWRGRLRPLIVETRSEPVVGWCLEIHDLWVAKAAVGREQDYRFCTALAREQLVDEAVCAERLALLPPEQQARAEAVLARSFRPRG